MTDSGKDSHDAAAAPASLPPPSIKALDPAEPSCSSPHVVMSSCQQNVQCRTFNDDRCGGNTEKRAGATVAMVATPVGSLTASEGRDHGAPRARPPAFKKKERCEQAKARHRFSASTLRRVCLTGLRLWPLLLGGASSVFASPTSSPLRPSTGPASPPAVGNAKVTISAAARMLTAPGASTSCSSSSSNPGVSVAAATAAATSSTAKAPPRIPLPPASSKLRDSGRLMDDHSLVKLLFLIVGLFWVLVVLAFLYWAPVVSFFNLLVLTVIVAFIKSEGSSWHHAQEFENRFWTAISFITSVVLVFSPDSPFGVGRWSHALGWTLCFSVAYAVHSYDRHLHRVTISRKPEFVRIRRGAAGTQAAKAPTSWASSSSGSSGKGGSLPCSPPGSPPASGNRPRASSGAFAGASGSGVGAKVSTSTPGSQATLTTSGIATAEEATSSTREERAASFSTPSTGTHRLSNDWATAHLSGREQPHAQGDQPLEKAQESCPGNASGSSCASATSDPDDKEGGSVRQDFASSGNVQSGEEQRWQSLILSGSDSINLSNKSGSSSNNNGSEPTSGRSASRSGTHTTGAGASTSGPRLLNVLLQAQAGEGERVADAVVKAQMEEKLEVIEHALKAVDQYLISRTVSNWFNMQKVLRLERTITNIFNVARTDELNFLVSHVTLALLFYKIKDHVLSSTKRYLNRTHLIELLAVTRISELEIPERAMVLDALQQMRLTAHPRSEFWVRNILLCTLGDSLSELKSLMDAKGDFQSLHKLVFDDIRTEKIRNEILVHIRKQAHVQAAHMMLGTRLARQRKLRQPWRKVLSDVDDTLASSGGRFPAGIDRRLPRHALYPGVLAFYRELDLGTTGPDEWGPDRDQGNLVFLSARPHLYKDVSEKHSYAKFRKLQEKRGMHTTPTLLAGSLDTGYSYVMDRNIEGLAQKKMENFEQFVSLYPEYSFVFIGDNGQGDLRAAELMAKKAESLGGSHPPIDAMYIHRIQPLNQSYGYDEHAFNRWRSMGICFFENYIEAAMDAAARRDPPLIRVTGLQRVVKAAVDDFYRIEGWPSPREEELRRVELNRSILRANDILTKHGLPAVPPILSQHKSRYEEGARVMTLYGGGTVKRYRPNDGVYEVVLDWTCSVSQQQQREQQQASSSPGRVSDKLLLEKQRPLTPLSISPPRVEHRSRSLSSSPVEGARRLRTSAAGSVGLPLSPPPISSPVTTTRGSTPVGGTVNNPCTSESRASDQTFDGGPTTEPNQDPSRESPLASDPSTPRVYRSATASTPLTAPTTQGEGGVTRGHSEGRQTPISPVGVVAEGRGKHFKGPSNAACMTPVVAYLQDSAILYAIPAAAVAATPSATTSSAGHASTTLSSTSNRTGFSSYISFFPGASYLSRLRPERGPRFPPGTFVGTPYGAGVVLNHRPAGALPPPSPSVALAASRVPTGKPLAASSAPPSSEVTEPVADGKQDSSSTGDKSRPLTPPSLALSHANTASTAAMVVESASQPLAPPAPYPPSVPQRARPEMYAVELRWGAKAYLPASALSSGADGNMTSSRGLSSSGSNSRTTSPRGGMGGGKQAAPTGPEPPSGILAGMMSLLSLGSGQGRSGGSRSEETASSSRPAPLSPGMEVSTRFGEGAVKECRERDQVLVISLPAGMTAYVPAARLEEFLISAGKKGDEKSSAHRKRRPRSMSALENSKTVVGTSYPVFSSSTGESASGIEGHGRRSLSPVSGTNRGNGVASSSLLGFWKGSAATEKTAVEPAVNTSSEAMTRDGKGKDTPLTPSSEPCAPASLSLPAAGDQEQQETGQDRRPPSPTCASGPYLARSQKAGSQSINIKSSSSVSTGLRGWWGRGSADAVGKKTLAVGDRVSAGEWGEAVVLRVQEADSRVEVAFTRWRGRGFLRTSAVKPC